jgi:hypothetical protein
MKKAAPAFGAASTAEPLASYLAIEAFWALI